MKGIPNGYRRVSARQRCPICNHPDWCLIAIDRATALCPRVSTGAESEWGECGFLHVLDRLTLQARTTQPRKPEPPPPETPPAHWGLMAEEFSLSINQRKLELLAASLGLTVHSLRGLGVGWSERDRATTFPMKNDRGGIVGIRLRAHDGRKWAIKGSQSGLFYAGDPAGQGRVLVPEGPTDTAALMDLGFFVVGRPFCSGGWTFLEAMARAERRDWIIVGDCDGPGRKSAERGADRLIQHSRTTKLIYPAGGKDVRQWINEESVTRDTVRAVIDNARLWIRRSA